MKSLSILVISSILAALILSGIFAVGSSAAAGFAKVASHQVSSSKVKPVAPVTGEAVSSVSETTVTDATTAMTFSFNIEKDIEGAQSVASFENFVTSVSNGKASQVTGIYVEDVLAYSVVRQPNGNAAYVSGNPGEVTQFGMAADYGSMALLAHNYLAGATFFQLTEGQIVTLVYGDGNTADFQIQSIRRFQALSPNSTQSRFVDLDNNEQLSASNLFYSMYNGDNLVLQTCIANEGISTWGRLFVIAVPLS